MANTDKKGTIMAKPKKGRTSKLTVRMTPEEYKHFLVLYRRSGLTQADYILKAIDFLEGSKK